MTKQNLAGDLARDFKCHYRKHKWKREFINLLAQAMTASSNRRLSLTNSDYKVQMLNTVGNQPERLLVLINFLLFIKQGRLYS